MGGITAFAANLFLQRVLGMTPPPGLEWLFQQLFPLAVFCAGGLACLVAVRVISEARIEGGVRGAALLSLLTEIGIIAFMFLNDDQGSFQVVDKIMNLVSGNELIAFVVAPVLLFIVLDVVFSILAKIFSRDPGPEWLSDSKGKLLDIEKGLMDLVLNLITGFMNLLLFIPDFFNQIGYLLLGEDAFFPQNKIPTKQQEKDPAPSGPCTPENSFKTPAPPSPKKSEDILEKEEAK